MRILSFIILLLFTVSASAQRKKKGAESAETKPVTETKKQELSADSLQTTIFRTSMKYGDYQSAASALYHLMALHPENESLKDSLVLLYNGMGSSVQAVLISREILKKNPNNLPVLNAMAQSEQRLGLFKEALSSYEILYDRTQNLYDLYQVAALQFAMKRYMEAQNTLAAVIRNPKSTTEKLNITGANNSHQDVIFKAAAYNLMGVVALEMKEYTEAQNNFKRALEAEPTFELAQNNLQILVTELNKQKTPAAEKSPAKKPVKK